MKIKLAILEHDESYLAKIAATFNSKYGEHLEVYSFTDKQIAISTLESAKIDLLIASDSFEIDQNILPRRCGLGFLVESADIEAINSVPAIFKYQKIDLIYKQILSLYAETAGNISGVKFNSDSTSIIIFSSACGGVGTTTMAAACAIHYAKKGHKTLFLELERFGYLEVLFQAEGAFDMSDIIFSIKSKKQNLALKLESSVRQDKSGVYFFASPKTSLDLMELKSEEIVKLISELQTTGEYEYIVIDMDYSVTEDSLEIFRLAHRLVMVSDGSEIANKKTENAYVSLATIEQASDAPLTNRLCLVYNKFSNKTGRMLNGHDVKNIGGAPVYIHASIRDVLAQISPSDYFDSFIE